MEMNLIESIEEILNLIDNINQEYGNTALGRLTLCVNNCSPIGLSITEDGYKTVKKTSKLEDKIIAQDFDEDGAIIEVNQYKII